MTRSDFIRVYFFAKRVRQTTRSEAVKQEALEIMLRVEDVVGQLETLKAADQK